MKNFNKLLALLLLVFGSQMISAQQIGNLEGINYQAVAIDENGKEIVGKDVEGKPLYNKSIGVRFSIIGGVGVTSGGEGPILYQDTHTTLTDQYGLFSLVIGQGENTGAGQYDNLMDIPWIDADQFLKVEISIKNDGNYKLVSMQKFMAVPYSFYTDDIADNAITTAKILDSTIVNQDIATGAVETRTILDLTILNEDIATGSVDTRTILDSTIINEDIATGAVDSRAILDLTILNEDIATGSVDSRTILDSTIINQDIAIGAVDTRAILDSTILNEDIATGSVDSRTILDSTILNEDIATSSVDSRTILDLTILNDDIATGSVDSRTILDGTIQNQDIANGTIDLTSKVTGILPVPNGGTGVASSTDGGILLGGGTNPIKALPQATDMQIPIGVTASDPVLKKLAPGSGIVITSTADSVIISSGITGGVNADGTLFLGDFSVPVDATYIAGPFVIPGNGTLGDILLGSIDKNLQGCMMTTYYSTGNTGYIAIFNGTASPKNFTAVTAKVLAVK